MNGLEQQALDMLTPRIEAYKARCTHCGRGRVIAVNKVHEAEALNFAYHTIKKLIAERDSLWKEYQRLRDALSKNEKYMLPKLGNFKEDA